MTKNQEEKIRDNLLAYLANFPSIRIVGSDYGGGFYVYSPGDSDTWVQYCENINYLNGWLYGMVQAINGRVKPREEKCFCKDFNISEDGTMTAITNNENN